MDVSHAADAAARRSGHSFAHHSIMTELINDNVLDLLQPAGSLYQQERYEEALKEVSRLWGLVPEPKTAMPNTYLIVLYGARLTLKRRDFDGALEWAMRGLEFSGNRNLGGESEFLAGEVYYEMGDMENARVYFNKVHKLSGYRFFREKNPAFKDLVKT
jgi:tetratricopeptide (TPR) repeat protein